MNHFITNIHVNKLFHLNNFDIPIRDEKYPHLIITGKNGSGKTILLNAMADFLGTIKEDTKMGFTSYEKHLDYWTSQINRPSATQKEQMSAKQNSAYYSQLFHNLYGKVDVSFNDVGSIIEKYQKGQFVIAFYEAARVVKMSEPKNPTKPQYNKKGKVKETATSQFLNFLSDLKIQEALARNENQNTDADEIGMWFSDFKKILQEIFQDDNLTLEFNYKDYSFHICTEGKRFKFTEVSDGFSAILDIIADLILKMQGDNSVSNEYLKEGIVLIDEIETHLHLELQKVILPLMSKLFPNIQFIVTTHSPFVLNSIPNAVAYDLEHREILEDLTEYSYEALAEGYFGVRTPSSYAEMQLNNLKTLLEKKEWTDSDKVALRQLTSDFNKISETASPLIVGEYRQLAVKYANRIKEL
jgi:predicted ATP-binding protein involved in virulence